MKATNIKWDTNGDKKLLETLPTEVEIPDCIDKEDCDAISDYISDTVGFCHFGFELINTDVNYTWKDIVEIQGNVTTEEFPISGIMDDDSTYQIDDFLSSVAKKYGVSVDDVHTYMMDDIDYDPVILEWGSEDCGCYINGIAEWLV